MQAAEKRSISMLQLVYDATYQTINWVALLIHWQNERTYMSWWWSQVKIPTRRCCVLFANQLPTICSVPIPSDLPWVDTCPWLAQRRCERVNSNEATRYLVSSSHWYSQVCGVVKIWVGSRSLTISSAPALRGLFNAVGYISSLPFQGKHRITPYQMRRFLGHARLATLENSYLVPSKGYSHAERRKNESDGRKVIDRRIMLRVSADSSLIVIANITDNILTPSLSQVKQNTIMLDEILISSDLWQS